MFALSANTRNQIYSCYLTNLVSRNIGKNAMILFDVYRLMHLAAYYIGT